MKNQSTKNSLIIRLITEEVQIEYPTRMNNIFSVDCDTIFAPERILTLKITHLVFSLSYHTAIKIRTTMDDWTFHSKDFTYKLTLCSLWVVYLQLSIWLALSPTLNPLDLPKTFTKCEQKVRCPKAQNRFKNTVIALNMFSTHRNVRQQLKHLP